jgi:polyhydroxyalkanoate synthesis regulator phasin
MVEEQRIFSTKTQEMENIFQNKIKELENREPEKVEIIVEKPVTTIDNSKQKLLEETIQKLRNELQLKNKEINDLKSSVLELQKTSSSKAIYMDGSNLGKTIR